MPAAADSPLLLGTYTFRSRLFLGTGKYASYPLMREALAVSTQQRPERPLGG